MLLVLPLGAAAGQHQRVDPETGPARAEGQQRAARPDRDVVAVGAASATIRPSRVGRQPRSCRSHSAHGRSPREYASSSSIRSLTVSVGRQ